MVDGPGWVLCRILSPPCRRPQGLFVAFVLTSFTPHSYAGEDGQAVEYPDSRPVYALISPEDYLAGTPNFQEIQNLPLPA